MKFFVPLAACVSMASAGYAQNGWLLVSQEEGEEETSDGAKYIEHLLGEYAEEGAVSLYDPESPEAKIEFCKTQLGYAERSLAQALSDYEYSVSISVKGVSPHNLGTECTLHSTRKAEIKLKGPTE